jgi:hypothetical protein
MSLKDHAPGMYSQMTAVQRDLPGPYYPAGCPARWEPTLRGARSSADPVDVLVQNGPICAPQSVIVEDLATAYIGGSTRVLPDLLYHSALPDVSGAPPGVKRSGKP